MKNNIVLFYRPIDFIYLLRASLLIFFMFALGVINSAQKTSMSLISFSDDSYDDLSFELRREIDRIHEDESIIFQAIGIVEEISTIQDDGKIAVLHPENLTTHEFQVIYSSHFPEGYYWYGSLLGGDEGYISFISYNGFRTGNVKIGDGVYQFEDIGEGITLFYELDDNDKAVCGDAHFHSTESTSNFFDPRNSNCDVDVVALFTERFRKKIDGNWNSNTLKTHAVIKAKIEECNVAKESSDLDVEFKFILKAIRTSDLVENINEKMSQEHVVTFAPSSQNAGGELLVARATTNSDFSVIFTHGKYRDDINNSRIGGSAGTTKLDSSLAYVVMEKKGMRNKRLTSFTLAHELFHLFAAQHVPIQGSLPFAAFIEVSKSGNPLAAQTWGSLMINQPISGRLARIELSNPDITIDDLDFGIENEKDNAKVVSKNTCRVSGYRIAPMPQLSINIFHNDPICHCVGTTPVEALAYNGQSPYSFSWKYSWDGGFNWVSFGSGNSIESVPVPCNGSYNSMKVQVTVTDNNGQSITRNSNLLLTSQNNCNDDINRIFDSPTLNISPNPYGEIITIDLSELTYDQKEKLTIRIYELSGKLVYYKSFVNPGNSIKLNIQDLTVGVQIVEIISESQIYTHKIMKQ